MLTVVALLSTMSFAQSGTFALVLGSDMIGASWQDYSINSTVGYFVSDAMLVGTGLSMTSGYNSSKTKEISPVVRYYLSGNLYAMAGISMMAVEDVYAGIGLSLMWNDKVAIEPGFWVTLGDENMTLAVSIGISIRLGMDE